MHHHDQIRIGSFDGLRLMLRNVIIIGDITGIAIDTIGTECDHYWRYYRHCD